MKAFSHRVASLVITFVALYPSIGFAGERSDDAASRVQVEYIHPEKFTDVRDRYFPTSGARDIYLGELRQHVQRRAVRYLQDGQNLLVTITEVDMAGGFEPGRRSPGDQRIVRDVYPPRIDLAFKMTGSGGAPLKQGERQLRNLAFLTAANLYFSDPLRYEKTLLDDWLDREFRTTPD